MTKPIFYFESLKSFDKWTIGSYILLTIVLFSMIDLDKDIIFAYSLSTQLCLYAFCYKSLRNLTVYFIWIAIGFFHLYMYFNLKDDLTLQMFRLHSAILLRNTLPLLFLFQVFRFLSAKIQGQELVSPSRGGGTDLFDGRKANWLDYLFFFIYVGCTFLFGT